METSNKFCGVEMDTTPIGEVTDLKYDIKREVYPPSHYPTPRSFSRGKRGIAGSFIFLMFDREAILHGIESSEIETSEPGETSED